MDKKNKIIIGSLIGIGLLTTLMLILRKKTPKLSIETINWTSQFADVKFGNDVARVSPFSGGVMNAGKGFKKGYTLSFITFDKDKVRLITKLNNKDLSEHIIEFESRLSYKQ